MSGVRVKVRNRQLPEHARLLLAIRRKHCWSQARLAAEVGIARSSVARWERGENDPHPIVVPALRDLLEQPSWFAAAIGGEPARMPVWTDRQGCQVMLRSGAYCPREGYIPLRDGHRVCKRHLEQLLEDGWIVEQRPPVRRTAVVVDDFAAHYPTPAQHRRTGS